MKEYLPLLRAANENTLPERLTSSGVYPIDHVKELYDAGYLTGIDASDMGGREYIDLKLTATGRSLLSSLEDEASAITLASRTKRVFPPVMKWVFGILSIVIAAIIISYLKLGG